MKNKLIIISLGILFNSSTIENSTVFICDSPTAKKYHFNKECRGLNRCTHEIKKISKSEAVKIGFTVCLIEN